MTNSTFDNPRTRFFLVFQVALIALVCFTLLRLALLVRVWHAVDHGLLEWGYIFGTGLIYDLAFLAYFSIPFGVLLLFVPNKFFNSCFF